MVKTQTKLGAFLLKDEEVDTIPSGSLFAKRKVKTEGISSQAKSTAVELREASKNPSIASTSSARLNSEPQNSKRKEESVSTVVIPSTIGHVMQILNHHYSFL